MRREYQSRIQTSASRPVQELGLLIPTGLWQQIGILLVLMLTSKGAAVVTGGGFITLAAALSMIGRVPVAGLTLLLGLDRFMSECRAISNLIGNGVATLVVAAGRREWTCPKPEPC